jgi:anti-sigma regulatory factor (Ser/Thr protein kinase)
MGEVGHNPARIIPAWQTFVGSHKGAGRLRGVGEPVGPDRGPDELVECERHEDVLNLAFADAPPFWLLCPYDMSVLPHSVVDRARANHPIIARNGSREDSADYRGVESLSEPFTSPLRDAPPDVVTFPFFGPLATLRVLVAEEASRAGLPRARIIDLVLAVNEIATNTLQHGGGDGVLRIWHESDRVICEIRDRGKFDNPLADRRLPHPRRLGGRGLWTANHVCDLVQIRTHEQWTVVRLHMTTDESASE